MFKAARFLHDIQSDGVGQQYRKEKVRKGWLIEVGAIHLVESSQSGNV